MTSALTYPAPITPADLRDPAGLDDRVLRVAVERVGPRIDRRGRRP